MDTRSGLFVAAILAAALGARAQGDPNSPMQTFVLIFRQTPRQFSEADLKGRAHQVRSWVGRQVEQNHKLDPRILAPESAFIGVDGKRRAESLSTDPPVTALLFVEAKDLADAVTIAETHPAVKYGASVEVRPWAPPVPVR
jgi:hypothetical protein